MTTKKVIGMIVAAAVGLGAVITALTMIGLTPGKLATQDFVIVADELHHDEYLILVGSVQENRARLLGQAIRSNTIRAGELRMIAEEREAQGKKAASIRRQINEIERETTDFDQERRKILAE